MKALTLHQPWAWAICHAGKRVENRTWAPPRALLGQRIAIHAGLRVDRDAMDYLEYEVGLDVPETLVRGAIVATARLVGAWRPTASTAPTHWHCGPWCWELDDVIVLPEPVPCKGRQGLWDAHAFDTRGQG